MINCLYEEDNNFYQQCELTRDNLTKVAWIPRDLAKPNNIVEIKESNIWSAWKIVSIHGDNKEGEEIKRLNSQSIRNAGQGKQKRYWGYE